MRKGEIGTRLEMFVNRAHIERTMLFIRGEHHDDIGERDRILNGLNVDPVAPSLFERLRAFAQSNDDAITGFVQIERVRAPLAPVADNRDRLAAQRVRIRVLIVEGVHSMVSLSSSRSLVIWASSRRSASPGPANANSMR